MKGRHGVSLVTLALLALVVALGWKEILQAWDLLGAVDLRLLALLVPVQFLSYCATGEVLLGYLRSKGMMREESWWLTPRVALELNFVHHVAPSAGLAGFSYLGWALRRYDVTAGRATMAQIVQVVLTFVSYTVLLVIAVAVLAFEDAVNRAIVLTSSALVVVVVAAVVLVVHATSDRDRLMRFSGWITRTANGAVEFFSRGRKRGVLRLEKVEHFFHEVHQDYVEIRDERRLLLRPFLFSALANCLDISLLYISFLAIGIKPFNPAIMVIAFGLSSILGMAAATPGGAGVYETAMIVFLSAAGVPPSAAIAGTLLARVILLLGTLVFGYVFYQSTIATSGKPPAVTSEDEPEASDPQDVA